MIETLHDIDSNTPEGKMLVVAIAKLNNESQTEKTAQEIIAQLNRLQTCERELVSAMENLVFITT